VVIRLLTSDHKLNTTDMGSSPDSHPKCYNVGVKTFSECVGFQQMGHICLIHTLNKLGSHDIAENHAEFDNKFH
jgi:hypothetical protein